MKKKLKKKTNYVLEQSRQRVTIWIKTRIDELINEELRSNNEELRDDFKVAIEKFVKRIKKIVEDI